MPEIKMWIEEPEIVEIALAGTPAIPKAKFAVMKSMTPAEGKVPIIKTVPFFKDEVKKKVFGYVAVPDEADLQEEAMTKEHVEKACHSYFKNAVFNGIKGKGVSKNHIEFEGLSHPIESCIDKGGGLMSDYGHPDDAIAGAWWVGMQLDDEAWDQVQKGEFTGFSMGGFGLKIPVEGEPQPEEPGAFQKLWAKVTTIVKAEGDAMSFQEVDLMDTVSSELWKKLEQLEFSIHTIIHDPDVSNKQQAIGASIDQFRASLLGALSIAKAGKEISAANMKLIEDALLAFGGLQDLIDRLNAAKVTKATTKGDPDMAHTLESLGESLAALSKTIKEEVMPKLGEFETFKKAQDEAAKGTAKEEPTELEKAVTKALEPMETRLGEKIDAMDTRLKKVEETPGEPKGNPSDGSDGDDQPKPPQTAEELEKAQTAGVAKAADKMLYGRDPQA